MDNTVKITNDETAATDEALLSDEMIAKIIEREKEIAQHPDTWISVEQFKRDLASKK